MPLSLIQISRVTDFAGIFTTKPKYDYLYCGSSLYGNLSPQRVREWIAYHVRLFGPRSHFVIHDAGGIHEEVLEVLKPWMELRYVTLQDIREQERFDWYYHNQFFLDRNQWVCEVGGCAGRVSAEERREGEGGEWVGVRGGWVQGREWREN
ncbi:hypothetical protein FF1_002087 [Malus domestica]